MMTAKFPIHSSAPASFSTYLKSDSQGLEHGQLMIQHWCSVGLSSCLWRNGRHFEAQGTLQAFETNSPPNMLPIHSKCWRDTCVLCLTGDIMEQRAPGALKTTANIWVLVVCSTQHTIHTNSACTCSLAATPGSRRYSGAILWTYALTATVRFSSSLAQLLPGAALILVKMLVGEFPSCLSG